MRSDQCDRLLAPLLGLALAGAGSWPAAGAFEVFCEPAGVNTLACQRLDEVGTNQVVTCVDDPTNIRICTSPDGEAHTCVRSRGNVFTCEQPVDGSPETSHCQATGRGVYACGHLPPPAPQTLPVGGPLADDEESDDDPGGDLDVELDNDLMRPSLDD